MRTNKLGGNIMASEILVSKEHLVSLVKFAQASLEKDTKKLDRLKNKYASLDAFSKDATKIEEAIVTLTHRVEHATRSIDHIKSVINAPIKK